MEFLAMDNLGFLSTTKTGNKFIVIMLDHYSKLTRAVQTKTTTATDVTKAFGENWIVPYGIPERLLTDNGYQFDEKLFKSVCVGLSIKLMTSNVYHS